tara:strand:- start:618 stop:2261 length:1644 start_codon:yes stop_codon:yes gene_type:complete
VSKIIKYEDLLKSCEIMKNKLLHIWKKISENGISDDLDNTEKKRIKILNRIIFINAILGFTFIVIELVNYSFDSSFVAVSITFTAFAFSPFLFLLIMKKYFQVAKWAVILFFVFYVSFFTILAGKDSGMIVYFIPGILFPTILFQRKKSIIVLTSLIIGVFLVVLFINQNFSLQIITNQNELNFYATSNLIGCAIITLMIIWYFRSANLEYEKIILENTQKNLDLSRSILEQEKLVTIGEVSAGIAHDLNTPLGTIRVGSDNVSFILDKLLRDNLSHFSRDELIEILDHVKKNKIEIYVGGLKIRNEKQEMRAFLANKYPDLSSVNIQRYADLLVKCRIDISQEEQIQKIMERPNGMEYLEVLSQVQMAMAQLDTIKTSSDKAVRVVQDMRSFIKGESVVEQKMINLRDNISTVLSVFNYEISSHINLVFEVDPSIEILGYDIKLFQLWSNIVKNGLEAMSDQKERYLGIFAERKEDQLEVVFENNGPKIPDEIAGTIFKKYYTTKSKKSASGLGLSIVQNVLTEHNANIILESNESRTKFIITFDL